MTVVLEVSLIKDDVCFVSRFGGRRIRTVHLGYSVRCAQVALARPAFRPNWQGIGVGRSKISRGVIFDPHGHRSICFASFLQCAPGAPVALPLSFLGTAMRRSLALLRQAPSARRAAALAWSIYTFRRFQRAS
jgi:hypothetical protein